jgi:hypothetical protein
MNIPQKWLYERLLGKNKLMEWEGQLFLLSVNSGKIEAYCVVDNGWEAYHVLHRYGRPEKI